MNTWWIKNNRYISLICIVVASYLVLLILQTANINSKLQKKADSLIDQIALIENENQDLDFKIKYYSTEYAKELEARKLNLQKQGESSLIVEKTDPNSIENNEYINNGEVDESVSNWRSWFNFIF